MASLGDKLKRQRTNRGIGIAAIAEATKIPSRYLEALESNDLSSLPGTAFNKGYVRAYAQYVGLDPEEAVEAYRQEELAQGQEEPSAEELTRELSRLVDEAAPRPDRSRQRLAAGWIAVGVIVIGLAAGAGWYFLRPAGEGRSAAKAAGGTTSSPATSAPVPAAGPDAGAPIPGTSVPEPAGGATDAAAGEPAGPATVSPPAEGSEERATPAVTPSAALPPPARPAEEPAATPPTVPAPMSISDSGVGTDVVDHQLIGRADHFPAGSRVCFWTRVLNGAAGDLLRDIWFHDGSPVQTSDLTIGGPHWRTHSCKTLRSAGSWSVEARNAAGTILARQEFTAGP